MKYLLFILCIGCQVQKPVTKQDYFKSKVKYYNMRYRMTGMEIFNKKAKAYCDSLQRFFVC